MHASLQQVAKRMNGQIEFDLKTESHGNGVYQFSRIEALQPSRYFPNTLVCETSAKSKNETKVVLHSKMNLMYKTFIIFNIILFLSSLALGNGRSIIICFSIAALTIVGSLIVHSNNSKNLTNDVRAFLTKRYGAD